MQVTDLTARGYDGPASDAVQKTWLDVAWRALRRELRPFDLDAAIAEERVDAQDVVDVVAQAALRVLRNPEGAESRSGSIDDYDEAEKLADASSDVYFTAAELRRLAPVSSEPTTFAGSFKYS